MSSRPRRLLVPQTIRFGKMLIPTYGYVNEHEETAQSLRRLPGDKLAAFVKEENYVETLALVFDCNLSALHNASRLGSAGVPGGKGKGTGGDPLQYLPPGGCTH